MELNPIAVGKSAKSPGRRRHVGGTRGSVRPQFVAGAIRAPTYHVCRGRDGGNLKDIEAGKVNTHFSMSLHYPKLVIFLDASD